MPPLRPMVHAPAQVAALHGGGRESGGAGAPASVPTGGMTEEQRALEEARLEREQLEQRKRQEAQAKREAEERQRREAEARRVQEEREADRQRMERERHLAASDAQAQARRTGAGDTGGESGGDRWARQRLEPPAPPPPSQAPQRYAQQQGVGPSARGGHNQPYGGGSGTYNGGFHDHRQSHLQGRPGGRAYVPNAQSQPQHHHHQQASQHLSQQQHKQPSPPQPPHEQTPYTTDHHDDHPQPTRILQHPAGSKMLFDPKSGGMVEPVPRDRGMSESSASSDKKGAAGGSGGGASGAAWRKDKGSAGGELDEARRRRAQEVRAAEQEEQRLRDDKATALREARAKEAAEREPRTQGVLYRYNADGELERVLTDAERAEMTARAEARRVAKEALREKGAERAERERKRVAAKKAKKDDQPALTAEALSALSGEDKETAAQEELDEYAELLLEQLDINSDDVLQDSIEFVEVKSRRTISQERKESKAVAPPDPVRNTSPVVTGRTGPDRENRSQSHKVSRSGARDSPVVEGGNTASTPPSHSPSPVPLPLPAVPAWQAPHSTLVVIGAINGSAVEDTGAAAPSAEGTGSGSAGQEGREAVAVEDKRSTAKAQKVAERAEREKARREARRAKDQERQQKKRAGGTERPASAHAASRAGRSDSPKTATGPCSFDTSAAAKHLLGKDAAVRSSVSQRQKEASGSGGRAPEEASSDAIDLTALGLDSLSQQPDILQAFRGERSSPQQWFVLSVICIVLCVW